MKNGLLKEILQFAYSRRGISQKALYLIKGIIFFPFLTHAEKLKTKEGRATVGVSQAGDDVYPLF